MYIVKLKYSEKGCDSIKKVILTVCILGLAICGCAGKKEEENVQSVENTSVETSTVYIPEESTNAKKMATYEDVDKMVMKEVSEKNKSVIESQTNSKTTHMMWRISGDDTYLLNTDGEKLEKLELIECYWLGKEENNYIYFLYKAEVTSGDKNVEGYIIFEYKDSIISNGRFIINTNNVESRYTCSNSKEELIENLIEGKKKEYTFKIINAL